MFTSRKNHLCVQYQTLDKTLLFIHPKTKSLKSDEMLVQTLEEEASCSSASRYPPNSTITVLHFGSDGRRALLFGADTVCDEERCSSFSTMRRLFHSGPFRGRKTHITMTHYVFLH